MFPALPAAFLLCSLRIQAGGSGEGLTPLVNFYSKLPKGNTADQASGFKGKYFVGKNASGKPLAGLIVGFFLIGYTLDYQSAFCHLSPLMSSLLSLRYSALEYVGDLASFSTF